MQPPRVLYLTIKESHCTDGEVNQYSNQARKNPHMGYILVLTYGSQYSEKVSRILHSSRCLKGKERNASAQGMLTLEVYNLLQNILFTIW